MNEKISNIKSSTGLSVVGGGGGSGSQNAGAGLTPSSSGTSGHIIGGLSASNNSSDNQAPVPYVGDPSISQYHHHQQQQHQQHQQHLQLQQQSSGPIQNQSENSNKDDSNSFGQSPPALGGGGPPPPGGGVPSGGHHLAYGRYHHSEPNIDPYRYGHSQMQSAVAVIAKPQQQPSPSSGVGNISSSNRPPPQRYIPGQPPQGPTPTLNSLLQSHPPQPQHRYSNSYDMQQPQQQQQQSSQPSQQQQQQVQQPPSSHQPYTQQQSGWAPSPRPYSPQLGPSQVYRTPAASSTTSRGQSPYPPSHGQNSGSYPNSPQQPGAPPPPASNQSTGTSQYSSYPQRYPTPPGPSSGPNHRAGYSTPQYPETNRPWTGGSSPAASPGPGNHPHPPASPHQAQHGGPQPNSPGPGHAPSPSPQPSQASPSPHQELIGQNSNDSSSGGGMSGIGSGPPGTPNPQQVMRPTPSPTGSSGSRSLSPAVAQTLPLSRPSGNQSQSCNPMQTGQTGHISSHNGSTQHAQQQSQPSGQTGAQNSSSINSQQQQQSPQTSAQQQQTLTNQSANNMTTQANYPTQHSAISHMHSYKMGSGQNPGPSSQIMTSYPPPPQSQQYSQGNYPPRPQYSSSYVPTPSTNQPSPGNNNPPGPNQYSGRPMLNHSGNPHSQFPPYQQNWASPPPQSHGGAMMSNHVQGKGTLTPPPQANVGSSPRPLNYLKQHLQHKGSYIGGSNPTTPQGYGNGLGMHLPMGPPHHMGPPHGPTNMGPPTSALQGGGGTSGITGSLNTVSIGGSVGGVVAGSGVVVPPLPSESIISPPDQNVMSQDNGISSSGSSTASTHPVTSVVTTGPDGAPMDEVSQQSTLSNASAASGEDSQCTTPKSRKNDSFSQSHLAPPSTSPSGHPHSEDFDIISPPNWSRTPASPVFTSHVPSQDSCRTSTKKSDSLCKLYDMDENPERRGWLDKLLSFMEERRTPITACPTISKQPLDLYRLYIYVKERGGFVEVTKSKTWKDIAGLLGIGASSSAAYTLRKHYTKNLLAYECHFDRGDIDPLPIIQQVEAGSKKKSTKAASVPSPGKTGSSNSQDSFPAPASTNTSIDGYQGYPGVYPAGAQSDYNAGAQLPRPSSQSNAQTSHAGSPYTSQPSYSQYNSGDQYNSTGPPGQFSQSQGQFPPQNRTMYSPYGAEGETPQPSSNTYGQYGNRTFSQPPPGTAQITTPPGATAAAPGGLPTAGQTPSAFSQSGSQQQDYYRPPEPSPQPRRHPDFVKDSQPYPGYSQRPQIYGGWQGGSGQYRGQYPSPPTPQAWCNAPRAAGPPALTNHQTSQWDQHRYPPQSQSQYQSNQQQPPQWTNMSTPQTNTGSPVRTPQQRMPGGGAAVLGQSPIASSGSSSNCGSSVIGPVGGSLSKPPFTMQPPQPNSGPPNATSAGVYPVTGAVACNNGSKLNPTPPQAGVVGGGAGAGGCVTFPPVVPQVQKKDIVFPPDSVESITPVLYRRKRLTKIDVCPIDPWRIFMSMRSGLLSESTWALDLLNVLLFDDTTVQYFGLAHLPGMLSLLLEHFQKNLSEMFDNETGSSVNSIYSFNKKPYHNVNEKYNDIEEESDVDLGQILPPTNPEERVVLLSNTPNYTLVSRKGLPVRLLNSEDDIFVSEQRKVWDFELNKNYQLAMPIDSNPWTYGHSEYDPHDGVIDVFKSEIIDIPFARYMVGGDNMILKNDPFKSNDFGCDNYPSIFSAYAGTDIDEGGRHGNLFNKKRRLFTNNRPRNSCNNRNSEDTCVENAAKKSRVQNIANNSVTLKETVKQEEMETEYNQSTDSAIRPITKGYLDSDCREIDMDLEPRVSNNTNQALLSDDESSNTTTLCSKLEKCHQQKYEFDPKTTVRDLALVLHRRRLSGYEDECYTRDDASLYLVNESQDSLARRCICLSNIFRNLTFVPGNEPILAKSSRFLALLGRLLLLNHDHLLRTPKTRNYDREEDTNFSDSCSSLQGEKEWWWDYLISIRENMLVAVANIAGHLELSRYEEIITRPILDGLLHWAVCPSAHGQDPFPSCGQNSSMSPQRLALEALCKLCVTDANVDLVIATPPHSRLEKLCAVLTRHLCRNEDQVLREFSVNLLHYLAAADSAMARTVALQSPCISYLVAFIEQAEQTALGVANQHGINYLRENPDSMGTSLDMLRRAAGTLLHLSKHPDNRSLFMQQEPRLLGLVMSHILDQQVALIISRVLFQVSRVPGPLPSMEYRLQQRQQQQIERAGIDYKIVATSVEDINNVCSPAGSSCSSSGSVIAPIDGNLMIPKPQTISTNLVAVSGRSGAVTHLQQNHELNFLSSKLNPNNNTSNNNSGNSSNNIRNACSNRRSSKTTQPKESADDLISHTATLNDISNSSNSSSSCASSSCSHFSSNTNASNNNTSTVNSMNSASDAANSGVSSDVLVNSSTGNDMGCFGSESSIIENLSGNTNIISTTTASLTGNNSNNNSSSNNKSSLSAKPTQAAVA